MSTSAENYLHGVYRAARDAYSAGCSAEEIAAGAEYGMDAAARAAARDDDPTTPPRLTWTEPTHRPARLKWIIDIFNSEVGRDDAQVLTAAWLAATARDKMDVDAAQALTDTLTVPREAVRAIAECWSEYIELSPPPPPHAPGPDRTPGDVFRLALLAVCRAGHARANDALQDVPSRREYMPFDGDTREQVAAEWAGWRVDAHVLGETIALLQTPEEAHVVVPEAVRAVLERWLVGWQE